MLYIVAIKCELDDCVFSLLPFLSYCQFLLLDLDDTTPRVIDVAEYCGRMSHGLYFSFTRSFSLLPINQYISVFWTVHPKYWVYPVITIASFKNTLRINFPFIFPSNIHKVYKNASIEITNRRTPSNEVAEQSHPCLPIYRFYIRASRIYFCSVLNLWLA